MLGRRRRRRCVLVVAGRYRRAARPARARPTSGAAELDELKAARRSNSAERSACRAEIATVRMRFFSAADIDAALDFPSLVDALGDAFRGGFVRPERHHHVIERRAIRGDRIADAGLDREEAPGAYLGAKSSTCFPPMRRAVCPAVIGNLCAAIGRDGRDARRDGRHAAHALAHRRRFRAGGAASGARRRRRSCSIVGAGALAPFLARAHASQRPIEFIEVWNHRAAGAERVAAALATKAFGRAATTRPRGREADIISCATFARAFDRRRGGRAGPARRPVGAFNCRCAKSTTSRCRRARRFVDTAAALTEGGDVAPG